MKKHATRIFCILAASLMLASCSGNGGQNSDSSGTAAIGSSETSTEKPVKLKIMGSVDTELWETRENQPVWHEFQKWLADAGLEMEIEAIADEQYEQIIQTRTAAALDLPDLLNIGPLDNVTSVNLGESGIFQDVIPLVEQ